MMPPHIPIVLLLVRALEDGPPWGANVNVLYRARVVTDESAIPQRPGSM